MVEWPLNSAPTTIAYSIATSKAVMGQVSKEGSMAIQVEGWDAIQVEGWDAIQAVIYRKEDNLVGGIRKNLKEINREI